MENIKINIPEGYEINIEESTFEKIVFKIVDKKLTYDDIAIKLFSKGSYYIAASGKLGHMAQAIDKYLINSSPTREQLESILALNKLCNVAKYLNGDWLPNWTNTEEYKFSLHIDYTANKIFSIGILFSWTEFRSSVYFKTKELAERAIAILGEEEIRKALTLNH